MVVVAGWDEGVRLVSHTQLQEEGAITAGVGVGTNDGTPSVMGTKLQ